MSSESIRVSAPGSLMLMGEHAVLRGKLALAGSVNRRIRLALTPRADDRVIIRSALGRYEARLAELNVVEPFRFMLAALHSQREQLRNGLDLFVESDFSDQVGLGSSAAVTVATHAALMGRIEPRELFQRSLRTIRDVQGLGSGADVAASVWGGIIAYRAEPFELETLPFQHAIALVYSGHKTPTPEVVRRVNAARDKDPERFDRLFDQQENLTRQAVTAIRQENWAEVGRLFNHHQALQEALGVGTAALAEIIVALRAQPGILGAKISGSGLGDCAIGLGRADPGALPYEPMEVGLSKEGVRID